MKNKKNVLMLSILIFTIISQNLFSFENATQMIDSYNIIEQKLEKKKYSLLKEYYAYPVTVRLSNFKKITFANILPVHTKNKGWVRANFLENGDKVLYLKDGEVSYKRVFSTSIDEEMHVFYTYVDVQDNHTYFKDGVLVHNQTSHQTAGDSGNIQAADIIAASENENNNNDSGAASGSSGPSQSELALRAAQEALAQAVEAGVQYSEIEDLTEIVEQAEITFQKEQEEKRAMLEAVQVGDPVLATTGLYVHEELDIALSGNISNVEVSRFYASSNSMQYSMGRSWASILDSRLIRGMTIAGKDYSQSIKSIMETLKDIQATLSSRMRYKSVKNAYDSIQARYNEMKEMYLSLTKDKEYAEKLSVLNKYVVHAHTPKEYYAIGTGFLSFIDEKGIAHIFKYIGNGSWKPIDAQKAQYMKIESKDRKDSLSEKGFILYEKGGKETWFDKWGLIEKIVDKNDNEVLFERNYSTRVLEKITTQEGRSISFKYNGRGFIKAIHASDGKIVQYEYIGNNLASVIDTDGDKSSYSYDAKGLLTRFTKPDGSFVSFTYGLQNSKGDYLTTSTTNEEGFSEHFKYDLKNNLTIYTDHSGFSEYIYYDNNHRTIKEIDSTGKVTMYTYDSIGNVSSESINGSITRFSYDSRGNKIQETYSDGSKKTWQYNTFDQVTRYVDRDGKISSVAYDLKGNAIEFRSGTILIERAVYDSRGAIIKIIDYRGNETYFTYDDAFNVIQTKTGTIIEKFEYDSGGNLIKYIDGENRVYTYSHSAKRIVQTTPTGLQRTFTINNRKDIVKMEEMDLVTKEKRVFDYEYDNRHLLLAVKQGNNTLVRYTYYPAGQLKTEMYGEKGIEDCWMVEYEYYSGSSYSIHKKKFNNDGIQVGSTYSETFTRQNGGRTLMHEVPIKGQKVFAFDDWNRLVSIENFLGEKTHRILSPSGRLLEEQSTFGGWYEKKYNEQGFLSFSSEMHQDGIRFLYNPDGTLSSKEDQSGAVTEYIYNTQGLLAQEKKDVGSVWYEYDNIGRLVHVIVGNSNSMMLAEQYTKIEYSNDSRSIVFDYGGIYSEIFVLNAWGDIVQKIDGESNTFTNVYNSMGQMISNIDAYGKKTDFEYNAVAKISRVHFPNGTEERYTYNNILKLEKVEDALGVRWHGFYDDAGRVIQESGRNIVEKEYEYDRLDRLTRVNVAGQIIESYDYSNYGKKVVFTDGKNNDYVYSLDAFGRLKNEKNRLGESQSYEYDSAGRLSRKIDFNKKEQSIVTDSKQNIVVNTYSDSSEATIKYDIFARVAKASNTTGSILYTYNKAGLLEKQIDEGAGEIITYFYDKAGRRSRYISGSRDVLYTYGKNGELLNVRDTIQSLEVSFSYDEMMRETSRTFANGVVQETVYDKVGRTILIIEKARNGEVLRLEGYIYNEHGQIYIKVDEKALVTKYEYDEQGRLSLVYYPYTNEIAELAKQEAMEAGLFVAEYMNEGEFLYLSRNEVAEASKLLNMVSYARSSMLRGLQTVWKERFTYDNNSNRLSKTTAWGIIDYRYDAENRLVHTGVPGVGTEYSYDANGNLLVMSNAYKTKQYFYNCINRMSVSISSDSIQNSKTVTRYGYDAFGRRNMTLSENFVAIRTLYDGLSHDIIKEAEVYSNAAFTTSIIQQGFEYRFTESSTDRYLYVEEPYLADGYKNLDDYESVENLFTGEKTALYAKGDMVGISYSDIGRQTTLYYGTDILGSIRSATQNNSRLDARYEYDAFGNPYMGTFKTGLHNGYAGKPYNSETGLYNYGYRDYSPIQARFTTVDPIRDGNNWFSYVANDPVNFVDMRGLSAVDIGSWIDNGDGTYTAQAGAMLWQLNATGQNWAESDYVGRPEDLQIGQTVSFGQPGSVPTNETPIWPTDSKRVTSTMGVTHRFGIDIGAMQAGERGDTIVAVESGVVIYSGLADVPKSVNGSSYVDIKTLSGDVHVYVHMDNISVSVGDIVLQGNKLGEMSDIGSPDQVHLHFEVHKGGKRVNPLGIFSDNITDNLEYVK